MKELYISPELEILRFRPFEGIASTFGQNRSVDDGLSTEETRPGDYNEPVDREELR